MEIAWTDKLGPRQLGITNLEIFNGHLRVTIYLVRPNNYPKGISPKLLSTVAAHEVGHALGLFGHSSAANDMMLPLDTGNAKARTVSPRDLNTLKRIYESKPLPKGYQSPQPVGWPFTHYAAFRK